MKISLSMARRLALYTQGLAGNWSFPQGKEGAAQIIERLGYVQMIPFKVSRLYPDNSTTMRILYEAIVNHAPKNNADRKEEQFFVPDAA